MYMLYRVLNSFREDKINARFGEYGISNSSYYLMIKQLFYNDNKKNWGILTQNNTR